MDIASSASSRMRECGTAIAEAETAGSSLACGLDTLENRRCGSAEAGKHGGVRERLGAKEDSRSASSILDANHALLRIYCPNGFASMGQVESDLSLEARGRFRGDDFNGKLGRTLKYAHGARDDSTGSKEADVRDKASPIVGLIRGFSKFPQPAILNGPRRQKRYEIRLRNLMRLTGQRHADNLAIDEFKAFALHLRQL